MVGGFFDAKASATAAGTAASDAGVEPVKNDPAAPARGALERFGGRDGSIGGPELGLGAPCLGPPEAAAVFVAAGRVGVAFRLLLLKLKVGTGN